MTASPKEKVNILLVDDQPAKLLSYEVILEELNENLIKANNAREALEYLLKNDVAVVLIDVVMPELGGFELARMIHDHPRFQRTAIIFISAIQVADVDRVRGYELGAVDYVPVPVVPAVLRAKVSIFVDLHRKTTELQRLNEQLEQRVEERTAELQAFSARLQESERRRSLALAAGQMGSWDWDLVAGTFKGDEGQHRICGHEPGAGLESFDAFRALVHDEDRAAVDRLLEEARHDGHSGSVEFRLLRPGGETRWCLGAAVATFDALGAPVHMSGVTVDITERKQAEQRQALLAREVDHRSRNALAVVQSIIRLSRASHAEDVLSNVNGRIQALATAHTLLSESRWEGADLARIVDEELRPYSSERTRAGGPPISLRPAAAQAIALAIHELATNAAKHGALSVTEGSVRIGWTVAGERLVFSWTEQGGPPVRPPTTSGFGMTMIEANVATALSGKVQLDWQADGLRCVLSIPRANFAEGPGPRPMPMPVPPRPLRPVLRGAEPARAGARILVVEDEALVALMLEDLLTAAGHHVIGPFGRNAPALAAVARETLDGAVLDLNIAGEPVYPVADALAAGGVPFVLLTGYDLRSLDPRFAGCAMLQKPVEPEDLRRVLQAMLERTRTPEPERLTG